ncbi:Hypothetical predicted protein [Mytilus galloprovincialis]|uniref:TIR domain-containing protein n=1 Tax=Mytilus galloprovincialis TaxID=29158 RepID=A0A8B6H9T0_MYTGA|nr:Hypothetical predicted protein [Mytilus galloprovincialis]
MESYDDEDLLGWLFKDDLQNIELVELNIAPENSGLAPQLQPQAPSQNPLAPKPVEVKRPTVSLLQKSQKRFQTVTPEELKDLKDSRQAKSTKQNTKWVVKVFQGSIISSLLSLYITTSPVLQTDAHQTQSPGFIRSSYGFDRKLPICNRSIQRFIGEDVKIQCKWQSEFVHETKWTLNGMEIKQSERTKTIATRDNNNVDTVEIFLIDKNDYGTYQLWISGNSTGNGVNKDSKVLFKDMIALMVLTEKDEIKQTVTTRLRLKYIVLPDESYNIYGKGNNGTQPNPFENSEKSYLEEEIISCSFRQIIEVSLFALSSILFWKHLIFFLHRNVISTTIRFIFSLGASTEKECPSNAYDYEYDVLIVSTENDKDFVTENTIITSPEDKECAVCFPERDFDPGIPFLDSYSEVLRSSNTILVLFSEEFLEDPITYAIIYEILTMPSIKFRTDNILLIKIDECEIPSLLKKRCDFFDKTQLFPLESYRIELCIWLEARIPRFDRNTIRVDLAKLVFNAFLEMVFYYIVIVILIMYGCLPGSIFESYVGYCFCFAFVLQLNSLVRFIYRYISRNDEEKRIQNNM